MDDDLCGTSGLSGTQFVIATFSVKPKHLRAEFAKIGLRQSQFMSHILPDLVGSNHLNMGKGSKWSEFPYGVDEFVLTDFFKPMMTPFNTYVQPTFWHAQTLLQSVFTIPVAFMQTWTTFIRERESDLVVMAFAAWAPPETKPDLTSFLSHTFGEIVLFPSFHRVLDAETNGARDPLLQSWLATYVANNFFQDRSKEALAVDWSVIGAYLASLAPMSKKLIALASLIESCAVVGWSFPGAQFKNKSGIFSDKSLRCFDFITRGLHSAFFNRIIQASADSESERVAVSRQLKAYFINTCPQSQVMPSPFIVGRSYDDDANKHAFPVKRMVQWSVYSDDYDAIYQPRNNAFARSYRMCDRVAQEKRHVAKPSYSAETTCTQAMEEARQSKSRFRFHNPNLSAKHIHIVGKGHFGYVCQVATRKKHPLSMVIKLPVDVYDLEKIGASQKASKLLYAEAVDTLLAKPTSTDRTIEPEVARIMRVFETLVFDNSELSNCIVPIYLLQPFRLVLKTRDTHSIHVFGVSVVMEKMDGTLLSICKHNHWSHAKIESLVLPEMIRIYTTCADTHDLHHQDIHPGNILVRGNDLVWGDIESFCIGATTYPRARKYLVSSWVDVNSTPNFEFVYWNMLAQTVLELLHVLPTQQDTIHQYSDDDDSGYGSYSGMKRQRRDKVSLIAYAAEILTACIQLGTSVSKRTKKWIVLASLLSEHESLTLSRDDLTSIRLALRLEDGALYTWVHKIARPLTETASTDVRREYDDLTSRSDFVY